MTDADREQRFRIEEPDDLLLDSDPDDHLLFGEVTDLHTRPEPHSRRASHHRPERRRSRGGRLALVTTVVVLVGVALVAWLVVAPAISDRLHTPDYSGAGSGQVGVEVHAGDDATAIGTALHQADVVKSVAAFTKAAEADPDSTGIQPGTYRMHLHMSGAAALALMLTPGARSIRRLVVPEGRTLQAIAPTLATALGVTPAQVDAAAADVSALGIPSTYSTAGKAPTSAEGFLFPDTYTFDPSETPSDALQDMVSEFAAQDRGIDFATRAAAVHVTPYQALIVASMVEGEAKFDADRAKVARVIYNRLAAGTPLGIDATSVYGAELAGKPASSVTFTEDSPYNTRNRTGLPPTPIGNPGQASMAAAVQPASGNWIYYVNGDAQGHLAFFSDAAGFEAAKARCVANHWGCS